MVERNSKVRMCVANVVGCDVSDGFSALALIQCLTASPAASGHVYVYE